MKNEYEEFFSNLALLYGPGKHEDGHLGMTTPNELLFCEEYSKTLYSDRGIIYDLGTWFGATAAAFARGLRDRGYEPRETKPILARDLFIWQDWMNNSANTEALTFLPGDSFLEAVTLRLSEWDRWVDVAAADLTVVGGEADKVELLFIDAMKNWELVNSIFQLNLESLIPGVSLVVQQDYAFYGGIIPANILVMWDLREHFEFLHHVPGSCSVVFAYNSEVDPLSLPVYSSSYFTFEDANAAFAFAATAVDPRSKFSIDLCKFLYYIERGWIAAAVECWEELASELPVNPHPVTKRALTNGLRIAHANELTAEVREQIERFTK